MGSTGEARAFEAPSSLYFLLFFLLFFYFRNCFEVKIFIGGRKGGSSRSVSL